MQQVDLSKYSEAKPNYLKRILWALAYNCLFRWLPGTRLRYIRNVILRIFGAKIPLGSLVYGAPDKPCGVGRADANPKLLLNDT